MEITCGLCQNELKGSKYAYLSKGLIRFTNYDVCKRCFYKHLEIRNKDMVDFEWDYEKDTTICMCCNEKTTQGNVHSFGNYGVRGRNIWYNFCDECATKNFSSFITLINLSEGTIMHGEG